MIVIAILITLVIVDLEKTCIKMRNPPKIKIELIDIEESEDDPINLLMREMDESEDSEDYGEGIPLYDDASEIIGRAHSFISHEQETLDEKLDKMISEIEYSTENDILEDLRRCFRTMDDSILYATQFLEQAIEKQVETFTGFYYEMYEDARQSIMKTLTIVSKLRERNLFPLVPLVKDLTLDIDDIKVLVSRTTLEQVKEILEGYKIRRSHIRRKIEDF
jgi:hypothetical protein